MSYVFPIHEIPVLSVVGTEDFFPVHRIYCVGQNYSEHMYDCLLYTSPSPRDRGCSRMPSSA